MEFNIEEVIKINSRLANGESIRAISLDLKLNKSTITDLFKKNGYNYNNATRQYVGGELDVKPKENPQVVEKLVNKPIPKDRLVFNIPVKTKKKIDTKAFNIVVNTKLVDKLDLICKDKNYSRNQLVNYILEFFVDNMEK